MSTDTATDNKTQKTMYDVEFKIQLRITRPKAPIRRRHGAFSLRNFFVGRQQKHIK